MPYTVQGPSALSLQQITVDLMQHSPDSRRPEPRRAAFDVDDLRQGAVHVWHLSLDPGVTRAEVLPLALNKEELARAARIRREPIRQRYVATRNLLRTLLGRYLRVTPESLVFAEGTYGKPRLAGTEPDRGLVFNLSHSGNALAVALAHDVRLGVDIESWRPIADSAALAARCLAPAELEHWNQLAESERLPAFFRLWTLKEAFCKAVGRGIALGLKQCVFDCSTPRPQLLAWPDQDTAPGRQWYFHEITDLHWTSGAVACDRTPASLRRYDWPPR